MIGRRWNNGLHQSIEVKENLPISSETEIIASITYQNFFLSYPKLSGMTGTAKSSEIEFQEIYNLSVVTIPPYKENIRNDLEDSIYFNETFKWLEIVKECRKRRNTSQPILIGTPTIEKSESLGKLLKQYNLKFQLLNAKPENIIQEAEIIARAGEKNSITIATNMAGRGTDIVLGGDVNYNVQKKLYDILIYYNKYYN